MNIIITGASNGIGYHTALLLSKKKGLRILAVSRNEKKLLELAEESRKNNSAADLDYLSFDLENYNEEKILQKLQQINFNSVDILINNAGRLVNKPFEQLTDIDWLGIYQVNVFSPVRLIRTLIPLMGKSVRTHIVNIGSFGGFQGSTKFPGLSAYSSSKAALANLTECLAEEFKEKNISVNCLALGAVQTEMLGKAFPGYAVSMSPEQMSEFIVEFALNGNRYFNGKILPVTLSTI